MSIKTNSTTPWRVPSGSAAARAASWPPWPAIPASALVAVRDAPLATRALDAGPRRPPHQLAGVMRRAIVGCCDTAWATPAWLLPHQHDAARRIAGALGAFRTALLADQVGLGKSYVALALATRYPTCSVVAPASIVPQWRRLAGTLAIPVALVSHEALSRGQRVPPGALIVVDEAHRFRNPRTRRYDRLARDIGRSHVLFVTATPVVNRPADLVHLLRLVLADHALAGLGAPSLEREAVSRTGDRLMHAAAPLTVGRSAHAAGAGQYLPVPRDARIVACGSLADAPLGRVIRAIDTLTFPSFGRDARALLRQHLLYRLASSAEACRATLRRHRVYVERALAAAARGVPLARRAARRLFGTDDGMQFELGLFAGNGRRLADSDRLVRERASLERALEAFPSEIGRDPKRDAFEALLAARTGGKTLLFTAAQATALCLARALRWRSVAVVANGRAWVASGAIPVEEALRLFSPVARHAAPPPEHLRADLLIATDFASEGLDLQDADAVVHYDLPWTPLRLSQRLGRIARLGSAHRFVDVYWFTPPAVIARRLRIAERIGRKVTEQLRLAVTNSSRVGRARISGGFLDARERAARGVRDGLCGHVVTRGAQFVAFAIRWTTGDGTVVREFVASDGGPAFRSPWERTLRSMPRDGPVPRWAMAALRRLVRRRLRGIDRVPTNVTSLRLRRWIVRRGRLTSRQRDARMLELLDRALDLLHRGLAVGAERALADALADRHLTALAAWLDKTESRGIGWDGPSCEAVLVSEPE